MARVTKPLTDTEIRQAKPKDKEYSLADGKNLYLRVQASGSKVWILNYRAEPDISATYSTGELTNSRLWFLTQHHRYADSSHPAG